jgi:thiol-disulfide isomerase/thioredoxin
MNKFLVLVIIAIIALSGAVYWVYFVKPQTADNKLDDFAKCLTSAGAVMYGAEWCAHCQDEKKLFGDSFKYVNYIECPDNIERCLKAGVEGYPTWIFPDGKKLIGEQGLEKLSQESGCKLP